MATNYEAGDFILVAKGTAAPLYIDSNEDPGVTRAASDLAHDIRNVTGVAPSLLHDQAALDGTAVIIATFGRSALLDRLIREQRETQLIQLGE